MLITNGDFMWGTVFDDINKKALLLKIGDCLAFGNFLADDGNGESAIRVPMLWHVIGKKGNKLKLLSYFFFGYTGYWALQGGSFQPETWKSTWKETEIRQNLNNKYFYEYFSESEQNAILTTEVKTKADGSGYIITKDKLYVPALDEIEAIPEHLKIGRGLYADRSNGIPTLSLLYCYYWLRDPGKDKEQNLVVRGYENSKIVFDSLRHDADQVGVRTVMWVNAEKIGERRGNWFDKHQ